MRHFALLLLAALPACATTPEPKTAAADCKAFAAAVATICDVDQKAGLSANADPLGVGPKRSAWIADNVDNPDAIELRVLLSVKGPNEQATMLRDRAKALGIERCELAETLAATGLGGLSP